MSRNPLKKGDSMARTILNDGMWEQLHKTLKSKGCYDSKTNRDVMEAILWRLRTGAP